MDTFAAAQDSFQVLHIIVDKDNELLVYPHISLKWRCTKLVKCDELLVYPHIIFKWRCTKLVKCVYLTQINLFDLCSKYTLDTIGADQNLCQVLHIIVDKLNELLFYPHIIFMWSCTKLVKCDYLTQNKLFDLSFKIHSGDLRNRSKFMLSSSHRCRQG